MDWAAAMAKTVKYWQQIQLTRNMFCFWQSFSSHSRSIRSVAAYAIGHASGSVYLCVLTLCVIFPATYRPSFTDTCHATADPRSYTRKDHDPNRMPFKRIFPETTQRPYHRSTGSLFASLFVSIGRKIFIQTFFRLSSLSKRERAYTRHSWMNPTTIYNVYIRIPHVAR